MTTDVSQLAIRVDSSDAGAAASDLREMGSAAQQSGRQMTTMQQQIMRTVGGHQQVSKSAKESANAFQIAEAAAVRYGRGATAAAASSTNLMFQFQDIGMMLAAGQSPLLLAAQQGTQVAGIFQQMQQSGRGMREGIVGALRALVSPMALVTIGSIAAGAALFQFAASALGAEDDSKTLEDSVDELVSAMDQMDAMTKIASTSLTDLQEKFGDNAREARNLAVAMENLGNMRALRAQSDIADSLADKFSLLVQRVEEIERGGAAAAMSTAESVRLITSEFGVGVENAKRLRDAVEAVENATTLMGRNDALREFTELVENIEQEMGNLPPHMLDTAENVAQVVLRALELEGPIDGAGDSTRNLAASARDVASAFLQAQQHALNFQQSMASLSIPFEDAMESLDFDVSIASMGAADRLVETRMRSLEEKMRDASREAFGFDYGLTDEQQQQLDQYRAALEKTAPALTTTAKASGSAKTATEELTAAQRTANSVMDEALKAAVTYAQVEQELVRIAQERGLSQQTLNDALEIAKENLTEVTEAQKFWNNAQETTEQGVSRMIAQGRSLADVFQRVTESIAEAAIQAALFGSGPLGGGMEGILGGIMGTIFGGGGASPLDSQPLFAIQGNYEGGGHTGYGPRTGGLDNKGGFAAILHPQERIIDETRTSRQMQPTMVTNVKVIAPPGSEVNEERQQNSSGGEDVTITLDRAVSALARDPSSAISRTLGNNYGVSRQTRSR